MQDILVFIQHHLTLGSILIAAVVLLMVLESIKIKRSAPRLSSVQVTQFINHNNAVVVDLRKADLYSMGHIVGAISVPFQDVDTLEKKIEKYKSQPIILVCAGGIESSRAANVLQKKQFQIYVLAGGISAWKAADMPLVKGK